MKRLIALTLALALICSTFCGCGAIVDSMLGGKKYEALAGTWRTVRPDTVSEARGLLESIDAYEEELAIADLTCLEYVKTVTFNADKTYRFGYDIEGTKACVREFYETFFNDLYASRFSLNDVYGVNFNDMTKYEFQAFYADLYGYYDFDVLLDEMAENAYAYDQMARDGIETGTYTISGKQIMCTITGESEAESLEYSIKDGKLTLVYSNATEVYTKVN